MEWSLLIVGAVALAAAIAVGLPLLREAGAAERTDTLSDDQRRRLALREERDSALAALKDLEFDHRTGKITDDDYRPLVAEYRRRAAEALRALDAEASPETPAAPAAGPTQ